MDTIYVQGNILKALSITIPKNDVRTYLDGIQIEWTPHGVLMITTDGHRLSIARAVYLGAEFQSFNVPAAMVGFVKSNKHKYGISCEAGKVTLEIPGKPSVMMPGVDGKYPNWRRVMPSVLTDEPARYDLKYLGELDDARKLLLGDRTEQTMVMNGENGAIARLSADFFVVIMPLKTDKKYIPNLEVEEWAR